jgi:predicted nucleic acid-binding protein
MSILLDTNVLVRLAQDTSPLHAIAKSSVDAWQRHGESLHIVPQNLYEFWVVCTRPAGSPHNGLGLTIAQAEAERSRALSLFTFLPDTSAVYTEWERLVVSQQVKGKNAHYARLVAAMMAHGITHLLTFNLPDFSRYSSIKILDPGTTPP